MTPATIKRLLFWAPPALALVFGLAWLFRPQPVPVDLITVERGAMRVSVDEDGETRIRDVFVVATPVAGVKQRIPHKVGDPVTANETVIASVVPTDPAFLDTRSERQAQATLKAAEAALEFARADIRRAEAEFEYALSELERARRLARTGNISESDLDRAEREMRTRQAALEEAQAQIGIRVFELERARAALEPPSASRETRQGCDCIHVYSPVDGRILRILAESESVVPAGTELAEIGDPANLEVVVDLLSSDAVKVAAGQQAIIEDWGGAAPLSGLVRRVEPYGYTRVSALGIEEQRVNVIIDITTEREQWRSLGHGYRVESRIVTWQAEDVLKAPLTALFRQGEAWAVFAVADDGIARTQVVETGRRNGFEAEILDGLSEGDRIILHPGERVHDDARVVQRDVQ